MAKWTLRKVRINAQGYTAQGYYYGAGQPLYEAINEENDTNWHEFRAADREAAKAYIRKLDLNATFYR